MSDTILIVDDEDTVRRTFQEWLTSAKWDANVFAVPDAEGALLIANEQPIDLAILDWNLGSGSDGLRLLEDLVVFTPDIVAILVTGFAHQATPLEALRMGVRDYLDKNQNLTRELFLAAVRKQLDRIAPAKKQRELNRKLNAFQDSVEKVLPLVQASAALNDPVPLPDAVRSLFRFLLRGTGGRDGALIICHQATDGTETMTIYDAEGRKQQHPPVLFSRTLAASIVSMQEPCVMNDFDPANLGNVELFSFERDRISLLAASLRVGTGVNVVLEMFDKPVFTDDDRRITAVAAELGAELLRQGLAEKQTHRLLFDAVASALKASEDISTVLQTTVEGPPPAVMERLKIGLEQDATAILDSETSLRLLETVRGLAVRHGPEAVRHCTRMIASVRELLDLQSGGGGS